MKLGSRGKISAYAVLLGSYKPVARLPSSYMPFAYRYPTNILQHPDRTAFALAALSCCPVWVLQPIHVYRGTIVVVMQRLDSMSVASANASQPLHYNYFG